MSDKNVESGKNEAKKETSQARAPAITLPKGGGAIRGLGEKFAANPVTGTSSLSVPIYASPGRSGFSPQLSLAYDSGNGNSPFGFGWSLSLPSITRKTDKGLPKYQDADESDVFILSGAEDLVPSLHKAGNKWQRKTATRTIAGVAYHIQVYQPRIEGLFARIERWTNTQTGEVHWRSISRDNITTLYGKTAESRVADPNDQDCIFSWLISASYDDKGNAIVYEYVKEDSANINPLHTNEQNRTPQSRAANRYLKRVKYGNKTSCLIQPDLSTMDWLFELVFDYGEGHYQKLPIDTAGRQYVQADKDKQQDWPVRQDPFSSYHAGFEIRTYRLCHRVLMFHHFADELTTEGYLVRATKFSYTQSAIASFITSVTQSGYKLQQDSRYLEKSLPALEFEYSKATIQKEVQEIDAVDLENLPIGLDGFLFHWVDLDGEGLSGIMTEQGERWHYKRNMSPGSEGVSFEPIQSVMEKPSPSGLATGQQRFLDLAADGRLDLVQLDRPTPGFYERSHAAGWDRFTPFNSCPNVDWNQPNLRFVDLTGDGHADILITEHEAFTWYESLAELGFASGEKVRQALDEEKGPKLVFADGSQSIHLADISGDGLTDLVRIRNGEICYWPNLGYGSFGAKVTMDHAPLFDAPDYFDQRRIRLADIDGTGVTDILYLGRDSVQIYLNESGNRWSDVNKLTHFPSIDNLASVLALDLLGNGTACLVWSSPLPGDAGRQMRYIDLMGGQKPHLLIKTMNNLGAETHVQYAASTKFYVADKRAGKDWITKIPFPVHVVERITTYDRISHNRFVSRYAYHHGYFDGVEREFRGFGMVEQWDTEEYATLSGSQTLPQASNLGQSSHVPPILTKTWFHNGAFMQGGAISRQFEKEYYRESDISQGLTGLRDAQQKAMLLDDTVLPHEIRQHNSAILPYHLTAEEMREACRSLKGAILRQEIYGLDGTEEQDRPYSVSELNYTIELYQPRGHNRHAVFFTHDRETIDFHYERKLYTINNQKVADPRVSHAMTLKVDYFGNPLQSVTIAYGRRYDDSNPLLSQKDKDKQKRNQIIYTENVYTNAISEDDAHRTPLPCETKTYELLKAIPSSSQADVTNLFRFDEMVKICNLVGDGVHDIPYEDLDANAAVQSHPYRRLIEHMRTLYRSNDLSGPLLLGQLQSLALPHESYQLAFTSALAKQLYVSSGKLTLTELNTILSNKGQYRLIDSDWWIPSGQVFYSPNTNDTAVQELAHARQHFFLPHRFRDPFHSAQFKTETTIRFDTYDLLIQQTRDALDNYVTAGEHDGAGNITASGNDYRVLQVAKIMDPNGNCTEATFDTMGMVVGTAVMAKPGQLVGDSLGGFEPDLKDAEIAAHLQAPFANQHSLLKNASTRMIYDLYAYQRTRTDPQPQPAVVCAMARQTHYYDLTAGQQTDIQHSFTYSDGFGREIQEKNQAERGPVQAGGADVDPRWVGSGWTIFNNKGKPVRQYEPYFSTTHQFEYAKKTGVSPVLFYDPAQRVATTLHPNHNYEKVTIDPWCQETWDVNDTVLVTDPKNDTDVGDYFKRLPNSEYLPTWYSQNSSGSTQEQAAATKTQIHANTPTVACFDALGRPFLTIAHNRFQRNSATVDEKYISRVTLDIEGNEREVVDAQDRIVMVYHYDMLGNRVHQASMEAGARWMLNDVTGNPISAWDDRGHRFRMEYDQLHRPMHSYVQGADPQDLTAEKLYEKTDYGESYPNAEQLNLRMQVYRQYDGAGIIANLGLNPTTNQEEAYDFKGNLLRSSRQLISEYKKVVDWQNPPASEGPPYTTSTTYDAPNRPLTVTTPDSSVTKYTYNDANLLEKVNVRLRGAQVWTPFILNINYNAKGQRERIDYASKVQNNYVAGVRTSYKYDPDTFRLTQLCTQRITDNTLLQDLNYTYDPAGNITHIRDNAQQSVFFRNRQVDPDAEYTYDAIYRLIEATGREHLGQAGGTPTPSNHSDTGPVLHPGDGNAMGRYLQQYVYDEEGNFNQVNHSRTDYGNQGWKRTYAYNESSLLEAGKNSNRLSSTKINNAPSQPYSHDKHGNMDAMPHLSLMQWDFQDQLQATSKQVVNSGTPETTYYVYDADGQRVRKITERSAAEVDSPSRKSERIYLDGFEIYREYNADGNTISLERETLHVMDDEQRIAMVETRTTPVNDPSPAQLVRYQLNNQLGSASLELDEKAKIISYEEYYPYGSTSYRSVRNQTETPKRYRNTGKERDEENGCYYHGARYYSAWLCRWVASDPAGINQGCNSYEYVSNNPQTFLDEDGAAPTNIQHSLASTPKYLKMSLIQRIDIPIHRAYFGIPAAKKGQYYGGWRRPPKTKGPNDKGKRWDFYYTPNAESTRRQGKERPVVWRMMESASVNSKNVSRQLEALENTPYGVDVSLTLITAYREWGASFVKSAGRVDTARRGGLDFIGEKGYITDLHKNKFVSSSFPTEKDLRSSDPRTQKQGKVLKFAPIIINECKGSCRPVFPVENFPRNWLVEAYGAVLNKRKEYFLRISKADPKTLSKDALRVWTVLFFGAPGVGKQIVEYFQKHNLDYESITYPGVTSQLSKMHVPLRGALVRAAEAKFADYYYGF